MSDTINIPTEKIEKIRGHLLRWYRQHQRDLPWRGESRPYQVWISEVMLQQTQVVTVIAYYQNFLKQFPTLADLAAAPLADVLKAWEGLGYYARARNLHRAAGEILTRHEGRFPTTYAELRALPGFGEYTAGAVASIAFGEAVPAVDGNVRRVLARLFAIEGDVRQGAAARQLKQIAETLVDPTQPGEWTQTLMELGALVCLPRAPKCLLCPVNTLCRGRLLGLERELPHRPSKRPRPHFNVTAAVIRRDDYLLIAQRPVEGMLGGLWEFPGGKQEDGETLADCLRREIKEELDLEIAVGQLITKVKHGYTHFKFTLHAFACQLLGGQPRALGAADWRWVTLEEIETFPFPRTDLKIIEALRRQHTFD